MQYYVNENELMNFTYNGVSSTSFFMVIEDLCEFEIIFRVTPNVEVIA